MKALNKSRPLIIGIILDVSSSMQRNWKNKDGEKLPRIEVIRDALNEQFWKLSVASKSNNHKNVLLFCLGMGFQLPMYWTDVVITYGQERGSKNETQKRVQADVICDILALSEMVPSESDLRKMKDRLSKKWDDHVNKLLADARVDQNPDEELRVYIESTLRRTAREKWQRSFRYRLFLWLKSYSFLHKRSITRNFIENLTHSVELWEDTIEKASIDRSNTYLEAILNKTKEIFDKDEGEYAKYVKDTLDDYMLSEITNLMDIITIWRSSTKPQSLLNEDRMLSIASQIYEHLRKEVQKNITITKAGNKLLLDAATSFIGATLDSNKVDSLTEKIVQKHGWSRLESLVELLVEHIFTENFDKVARDILPDWIRLASTREVIRPIKQIANLLPNTFVSSIYSEEFMFGSTPVYAAMMRAASRLFDRSYTRRDKILIIVSDGEFSSNHPIALAESLKQAGLIIICCCIQEQNIVKQLQRRRQENWPEGAKALFDMASTVDEKLSLSLKNSGIEVEPGTKLFFQMNHSEILGDIISALVIEDSQFSAND